MSNLLGQQIGRYQLLDVIGQGGMGIVYRAFDPEMNRSVAIKMLHGAYAEDKNLLAMFRREARSTASFQHNNIVTVFSLEESQGFPYLVMEYLEGHSIAEIVSSKQSVHLVDKVSLICQVCDGLQYAHQRPEPVIHRDIKPANILVLKDGTAKIIDFGIARVASSETMTQAGQVRGSLPYMSPEQISGTPLDIRTDIYSAGVTLFQFLTGELPFKGSDSDIQSTLAKILNDPVPPLSKYLSDYPPELDQILGKAMAKNTEARYQTADDFGYDLSRLQESLKRGMTADLLSRAKMAIDRKDWEVARQLLQEVHKSDRRNAEAVDLLQVVRQEFQRQQRSVQVGQLRSQAQSALADQKFEEALECVDQALRLDPDNVELADLSQSIKSQIEREHKLSEALRQGHAALYAGDLGEAGIAVKKALQIDQKHTEARALESLIEKELAERQRRIQYQGLLQEARKEISSRNFLSALNYLQKAKAIDPADTNISELINWAAKGHEQEKRRKEIEASTNAIGKLLSEGLSEKALEYCHAALEKFPDETSLLKLNQLANHQNDLVVRKRAIDQAGAAARRLVDADKYEEAVTLLVEALRSFPGDPNLETLLAITRTESERRQEEEQKKELYQRLEPADPRVADTATPKRQSNLDHLRALEQGLARQLPVSQLRPLAATVANAIALEKPGTLETAQYSSALSEFQLRLTKWETDGLLLEELQTAILELKGTAETDAVLGRAYAIVERHQKDEDIRKKYAAIRQFASDLAIKREAVSRKLSDILQRMQGKQSIAGLLALEAQVDNIAGPWLRDDAIRDLVTQAHIFIEEAQQRNKELLLEVTHLADSIRTARSAGQVRLLVEQAVLLTGDSDDTDITSKVEHLQSAAQNKLGQLERSAVRLRELVSDATAARTIQEAENCGVAAEKLVSEDSESEEASDLLRRIQNGIAERRREYQRVCTNLERLVVSSAQASGQAELDLILARRRDVTKKYPDETYFGELEARLESSVNERRMYLAAQAVSDDVVNTGDTEEAYETARVDESALPPEGVTQLLTPQTGTASSLPSGYNIATVSGMSPTTQLVAVRQAPVLPAQATSKLAPNPARLWIGGAAMGLILAVGGSTYLLRRHGGGSASAVSGAQAVNKESAAQPPLPAVPAGPDSPLGNVAAASNTRVAESQNSAKVTRSPLTSPDKLPSDSTDWNRLEKSATTAELDSFIARFPHSPMRPAAEQKRENLVWNRALANGSLQSLSDYLAQYPAGRYAVAARQAVVSLDQRTFDSASDTPTLESLLGRYPVGEMHTKILAKLDDIEWLHTNRDSAKLTEYLKVFPTGRHAAEARNVLSAISSSSAAPSVTSPRIVTPTVPASEHPAVDDKTLILRTLAEYEQAYDRQDVDGIHKIWPSIPDRTKKAMSDGFGRVKSSHLTEDVLSGPEISGSSATVRLSQTVVFSLGGAPQSKSDKVTISLRKGASSTGQDKWYIDAIH